ncbi:bifunctional phosphopantothenoylcysteine decarboxylase/phosphopantothenate--cysteine ligase CoaBC [bacterium]|nr:MAG: bifunctional phosphopantothenoylcysteine decarboxylase/phosphopantothenate--cysteine ligase CoaBC [bacterium]
MALIALGVSGGISVYKAVDVVRLLQQQGHEVVVVMTANAQKFVGPLTFEAITRRRVLTDQYETGMNTDIDHIALASSIDALLVAPATANVIGKFSHGIADDFLSSLFLATKAPVLIAPAMNTNMYENAAVQENCRVLSARGVSFVDPEDGYLACGWVGKGRLAEPSVIVSAVGECLRSGRDWTGRTVLVTAGPTYEDVDPVRYVGNRSSGRMGFAIAAEAVARGARVLLVTGPTALDLPVGSEVTSVRSAEEMHRAVMEATTSQSVDVVLMAAAVSDYASGTGANETKIKKVDDELVLRLRKTPDILAGLGQARGESPKPFLVGFAAETESLIESASEKLQSKQVDMVVANDVTQAGAGFDVDTNIATLVTQDNVEPVTKRSKRDLARVIFDRIESCIQAQLAASQV